MTAIRGLYLAVLIALLVAGCSTGVADRPTPPASEAPPATTASPTNEPVASAPPATAGASPVGSAAPVLDQPWATAELTDVATGESFRLADLAGRPVIIETMAVWCTNCLRQQGHVYEALGRLDPGSVEYVLIDVDPSESAEKLAEYRDRNGFTGRYVVASRELARALADEFGDQVLNPPSTPMIVIGSDGRVTLTPYGQAKSPDEVVTLAQQHGA